MIDQHIQWHANNCGLEKSLKRSMLKKLFYLPLYFKDYADFVNPAVHCLYDEAGGCSPVYHETSPMFLPYSQETFNGMEYQAASHDSKRPRGNRAGACKMQRQI